MIYLKLIIDFFIVGLLSFGGAYSAIPLVKDVVTNYPMITDEVLVDFVAISESTPGPVAVNLATFVGSYVGGLPGAMLATLAEITPAFIIIIIFTLFFNDKLKNDNVNYALSIVRPCIIGLISSVGLFLFYSIVKKAIEGIVEGLQGLELLSRSLVVEGYGKLHKKYMDLSSDGISTIIIVILLVIILLIYKKISKKKLSAIKIIIIGAVLGIAINYLL